MAEQAVENAAALHAKSVITMVNAHQLRVDKSYQREPKQAMVERIASKWDEVSSELLLVSDRGERNGSDVEGGLFIVNGQHRTLAAIKLGIDQLHARVIDLTHEPDPAKVEATFRLRTNVRSSDASLERFKAELRSGDPEAAAIVALLAEFGTEVNVVPNPEVGINAIGAVEDLFHVDDTGAMLRETLDLIRSISGGVGGKVTSAAALKGYAWFISKHSEEVDRDRVIEVMHVAGQEAVLRRARLISSDMGGVIWLNYYRAIVGFYNERLSQGKKLEWRTGGASNFKGALGKWGRD